MILNHTKVEAIDKESRLLVKRTFIGDIQLLNRKHAVTNQIFSYERERLKEKKGLFPNAHYQTHHIFYSDVGWDYSELEEARSYADSNGRLLIPFEQRNYTQWKKLTWENAEASFVNLANRGLQIIPYPIPLKGTLEEWELKKEVAKKQKLPSQEIMPVLSSRHNEDSFQDIIKFEILNSKLVGIHLYTLNEPIEIVNLSRLRAINIGLKIGQECASFVGFNFPRRLADLDSINSAFVYSSFGIDIFSPRQMTPSQMKAMLKDKDKSTEQLAWLYDPTQGGYSTNPDQEAWHGVGLIDSLINTIPIAEVLDKYQMVIWMSTKLEQEDLNILNGKILTFDSKVSEYIKNDKSKWSIFWGRYGAESIG